MKRAGIDHSVLDSQPGSADVYDTEEVVNESELGLIEPGPHERNGYQRGDDGHEIKRPEQGHAANGLIHHQREEQRERDVQRHESDRVVDGVPKHFPEQGVVTEVRVVLKPHPLRRLHPVEVGEAEVGRPQDRNYLEQDDAQQRREQEEIGDAPFPPLSISRGTPCARGVWDYLAVHRHSVYARLSRTVGRGPRPPPNRS